MLQFSVMMQWSCPVAILSVPYRPGTESQEFAGIGTFGQRQVNFIEGIAEEILPWLPGAFVPRPMFTEPGIL